MNWKIKLSIVAAAALVIVIAVVNGLNDAHPAAVATIAVAGFIAGLAVGANNSARVKSAENKVPPIRFDG